MPSGRTRRRWPAGQGYGKGSVRSGITEGILALLLTGTALALVMYGDGLSRFVLLAGIFSAAMVQILVDLRFFLHMDGSSEACWNLLARVFTALILTLFAGGDPVDHVQPEIQDDVTGLTSLKPYVSVAKPLIVFGNMVTAAGGYLLACRGRVDPWPFGVTVAGIGLVVAAACVANNCIDRRIDRKMGRTRHRVLAQRRMSVRAAVTYASMLGIGGLFLLHAAALPLAMVMALAGFGIYVGLYSIWLKPRSVHATLVGSLAGAAPALAGYGAVSGRFDAGALMLLIVMCLWQVPHSYAFAVSRVEDYAAAKVPVLPVKYGLATARRHIAGFIAAFTLATAMLTAVGIAGYRFMVVCVGMGLFWLCLAGPVGGTPVSYRRWGRRLYVMSIVNLMLLCIMLSLESLSGWP